MYDKLWEVIFALGVFKIPLATGLRLLTALRSILTLMGCDPPNLDPFHTKMSMLPWGLY